MRGLQVLKGTDTDVCGCCGKIEMLNEHGKCMQCEDSDEKLHNEFFYVLRVIDELVNRPERLTSWIAEYREVHFPIDPGIDMILEASTVHCRDCDKLLQLSDDFTRIQCRLCRSIDDDMETMSLGEVLAPYEQDDKGYDKLEPSG